LWRFDILNQVIGTENPEKVSQLTEISYFLPDFSDF